VIFRETGLPGVRLVDMEPRQDSRGFFARVYCEREFAAQGLPSRMVQTNLAMTRRAGTLRGLHWQDGPHAEDKLVRCLQGAIWDVVVDLRPESPGFCKWFGVELDGQAGRMILVPKGFAHGYLSLTDDVLVTYQVSEFYTPSAERGARWNDPAFGIRWPAPVLDLSEKDATWPDFTPGPA
jgi:dTDP-4-dehydrorhamnose 3,5-epimerase